MNDLMKIASTIHCFHERIQTKHLFHHMLLEEESLTVVLDVSMLDVSEQETHWKVDGWLDGKQLLEDCCVAAAAWIVEHRCVVGVHCARERSSQMEIGRFWKNELILMKMIFCCRFFPSGFFLA